MNPPTSPSTADPPTESVEAPTDGTVSELGQLARLFLKLGAIGFGGPAAHIATMEREVVQRRNWLSTERFVDLIGATNLIPGPNSTELAIHIGYVRAGWLGLFVAGSCFILPAVITTMIMAWLYLTYGSGPEFAPALAGIRPAVLAIIVAVAWRLGKKAIKGGIAAAVVVLVAVLSWFTPLDKVIVFAIGALTGFLVMAIRLSGTKCWWLGWGALGLSNRQLLAGTVAVTAPPVTMAVAGPTLTQIFLYFLKVGSILYGTGYVLFGYLQNIGWISERQLHDAVAMGQFTPGPILSTATFVGFVAMDGQGLGTQILSACLATLGIFLPSFLFVGIICPIVPRLRAHPLSSCFLDAVNAAAMGILAGMAVMMGKSALIADSAVNWQMLGIFVVACVLVVRYKFSSALIVLGGALAGWLLHILF